MDESEKQSIWCIRNEIVKWCHQIVKDLARQDYDNAVCAITEIESIIETFYKENAA